MMALTLFWVRLGWRVIRRWRQRGLNDLQRTKLTLNGRMIRLHTRPAPPRPGCRRSSLLTGGGGRGGPGAEPYDRQKAWASINRKPLCGEMYMQNRVMLELTFRFQILGITSIFISDETTIFAVREVIFYARKTQNRRFRGLFREDQHFFGPKIFLSAVFSGIGWKRAECLASAVAWTCSGAHLLFSPERSLYGQRVGPVRRLAQLSQRRGTGP